MESDEYKGPDMNDFGFRSQKDEEFRHQYEEEMEKFQEKNSRRQRIFRKIWGAWPCLWKKWRAWETTHGEPIDQLKNLVHQIKTNPNSTKGKIETK